MKTTNKQVKDLVIRLQDGLISRTESVKYLGILLDHHLTFRNHIENLCIKISPAIGILSKVRWILPRKLCLQLYNSLIHSRLSYCIETWGSASKSAIRPLEVLQKKVVRFITFSSFTAHSPPLFKDLGILNIRKLYYLKICIRVFKELQGLSIVEPVNFRVVNHGIVTRSASNLSLCILLCNTTITNALSQTMSFVGPRIYNDAPDVIKNTNSISLFKAKLKTWLLVNDPDVYKLIYPHTI